MQLKVVKKLKDHRHPLSLAKDWTDFVLSDKSRSTHAYIIGSLDQAICIAPLDLLGAGIPTRMYESPVCRANLDSPRPKPQDCFSVRHLDDRTDGVSQYRGRQCLSEERSMHSPTVSACWNQVSVHSLAYVIGVLNRGKTMSLRRNTLSASFYIGMA